MKFNLFNRKTWGRKSPTEIIRRGKKPEREQSYIKYFGENLKDVALSRAPHEVRVDKEKLRKYFEKHGGRQMTDLHTHTSSPGDKDQALPSTQDIITFLFEKNFKTSIIAQQDSRTGDVLGYTILRKTEKGFKFPYSSFEGPGKKVSELFHQAYGALPQRINKSGLNTMSRQLGFRYKFIPAKGYELDSHIMSFVPKEDSALESKVIPSIIGLIFLASIFFISFNITGFVIANLTTKTSNIIGAGLFVLGIFGTYFYFKKK